MLRPSSKAGLIREASSRRGTSLAPTPARKRPAGSLITRKTLAIRAPSRPGTSARYSIFPPNQQPSSAPLRPQPKLAIGAVDDPLEHEADRIADQMMRMPDPDLSIAPAPVKLSRKCTACEEEGKKKLQMKPDGLPGPAAREAPPIVHDVLRGPGQPLDAATRAFFEPRFGHDFSKVRIHTGLQAERSAQAVNSFAYTVGRDIVFAAECYAPSTYVGTRLLAHELTHVMQQQGADQPTISADWKIPGVQLQRQDDGTGGMGEAEPSEAQGTCTPPYDTTYGPSSSSCSAYQSGLAKRFLTWTYRHNATCACENTPDDPKNNCVRKCLQVKMASFLSGLSKGGAAIGTCLDPIGILDFACPEPYCKDLYNHHVDCYRECCCEKGFIGYSAFWFMCEAPYPCFFVSFTIDKFNPCK